MPAVFTLKNALLTIDNHISSKLRDYQVEIAYDIDNRPIKLWIHDENGITLIRIQERQITPWLKGTSEGVKQKVKPRNEGDPTGRTVQ